MDKKIGLEHTIRLLMAESIGAIGTDKYKPVSNSFFKPVHIAPKKSGEHPDGSSTVRAARNIQKQNTSETMKEEEQIDEFLKPAVKAIEFGIEYGDEALEMLDKALKPVTKAPVPKKVPAKKPESLPFKEPVKPEVKPLPKEAPSNLPATRPSVKPETAPVTKPEVKPQTKPETLPATKPEVAPVTKPEVKTETLPKVQTQTQTLPKVQSKTQTQTLPKNQTQTQTKPKPLPAPLPISPKGTTPKGDDSKKPRKRRGLGFPTLTIDPSPISGLRGYVPIKPYIHYAKERVDEENGADEERKKIEAVPRPNGSRNRTRQAEIIRKIIEEKKNKKKKDNSTVEINPEINSLELDKT